MRKYGRIFSQWNNGMKVLIIVRKMDIFSLWTENLIALHIGMQQETPNLSGKQSLFVFTVYLTIGVRAMVVR